MALFNLKQISGKKLLVMGGIRSACNIIRTAKEMGVYTVVADYNPIERSPGKQIADESFVLDITDVAATVELIKREHIDGVLTGYSDMLLPYYAQVCRLSGLPAYGTKEQFELFTDKARYKALCREYEVPTVEEYQVDADDLDGCAKKIQFPVLVKPADSSGARGISICERAEQLPEAISKALACSKTRKALVERYLTGREVTVNWLFQDGEYYLTCIANRHVKHHQEGVIPLPAGYTYPASITGLYRRTVEPRAKEMFRAAGIKNGMMFMQCKVEKDQVIAYDIGYRLTGTSEFKNLMATCGFDPLAMMVYFALTGKMAEESVADYVDPRMGKYSYNVSLLSKPGAIAEISGVEKLKLIPGYIDAVIVHEPGETITEAMRGLLSQITLRAFGTADSKEEVWERMKRVHDTVHITSTEGEEMKLPGVELSDIEGFLGDIN